MVKHLTVVKNEAKREATIRLYGIIGDYWFSDDDPLTAQQFQKELTALEKGFDIINIRINSPGGSVLEGVAMANAIKSSRKEIHTYNDGLAASMASVILVSAKEGNRHAAKGSVTMLHSASNIAFGNAKAMRENADMLDTYDEVLAGFYADATGKTLDEIKADFFDGKDHFLTATDAEAFGMVKCEDYAADTMPANITDMSYNQIAALYQPEAKQEDEEVSPSLMAKIEAKIKSLLNPKNTEMKFPKLEALAKLGTENLTDELVNAAKTELAEAEIEGVSIVKDTELVDLATKAEKLVTVEASLLAKEAERVADKATIADLQAKLKAPADEGGNPEGGVGNEIPACAAPKNEFRTSVDEELEKYK